MDKQVTQSPANICVGIAQQANTLASDLMSGYWSAWDRKPVPWVFIHQAEDRIKIIVELIARLRATQTKEK